MSFPLLPMHSLGISTLNNQGGVGGSPPTPVSFVALVSRNEKGKPMTPYHFTYIPHPPAPIRDYSNERGDRPYAYDCIVSRIHFMGRYTYLVWCHEND